MNPVSVTQGNSPVDLGLPDRRGGHHEETQRHRFHLGRYGLAQSASGQDAAAPCAFGVAKTEKRHPQICEILTTSAIQAPTFRGTS